MWSVVTVCVCVCPSQGQNSRGPASQWPWSPTETCYQAWQGLCLVHSRCVTLTSDLLCPTPLYLSGRAPPSLPPTLKKRWEKNANYLYCAEWKENEEKMWNIFKKCGQMDFLTNIICSDKLFKKSRSLTFVLMLTLKTCKSTQHNKWLIKWLISFLFIIAVSFFFKHLMTMYFSAAELTLSYSFALKLKTPCMFVLHIWEI